MKTKSGYSEWKDGDRIFPNSAHTPTPWKSLGEIILTDDGKNVEIGTMRYLPSENSHANAAFIVKAVNCHEELIEAVKMAYQFFNTEANTPDDNGMVVSSDSAVRVVLRTMREAIAKAEASSATQGGK